MRSILRSVVAILAVSVSLGAHARAANPIEFEFGGVFTQTSGTVHQVGAPFTTTVQFDLDTPDLNPSSLLGQYTYLSWTAPYRNASPIVLVPPSGAIEIFRLSGGDGWSITNFAPEFMFELVIDYPVGTFPTDALPQTLDLSGATATRFRSFSIPFGVDLRGTINSFRVVPEPGIAGGLSFGVLFLRRFR